jgi:hypothetical protein
MNMNNIPSNLKMNFKKHEKQGLENLNKFGKAIGVSGWTIEIQGDVEELINKAKYESSGIEIWNYGARLGEIIYTSYCRWLSEMFETDRNNEDYVKEAFREATTSKKIVLCPLPVGSKSHEDRPFHTISFKDGCMCITFVSSNFGVNLDEEIKYCTLSDSL